MKKYLKKLSAVVGCSVALTCTAALNAVASVQPNPVISRGVPAYSGANPYTATAANDEHYFSFWTGTSPDYLAYDLSMVPTEDRETVLAVWYNVSSYDQIGNYKSRNMEPSDYTIEVNPANGGTYPESSWKCAPPEAPRPQRRRCTHSDPPGAGRTSRAPPGSRPAGVSDTEPGPVFPGRQEKRCTFPGLRRGSNSPRHAHCGSRRSSHPR